MAEKQRNRIIVQTLERRPRSSKVKKSQRAGENVARLGIPARPWPGGRRGPARGGGAGAPRPRKEPGPGRPPYCLCLSSFLPWLPRRPRRFLHSPANRCVSGSRRRGGNGRRGNPGLAAASAGRSFRDRSLSPGSPRRAAMPSAEGPGRVWAGGQGNGIWSFCGASVPL